MNLTLLSIIGYQENFYVVHDELNDGHVNVLIAGIPDDLAGFEDGYLKTSDDIVAYSARDVVPVNGRNGANK